jgi:hypothetical protein
MSFDKRRLMTLNLTAVLLSGQMMLLSAAPAASETAPESADVAPMTKNQRVLLKAGVSKVESPLEEGVTNSVPAGTAVSLTMLANVNSEVTKVGESVVAMISLDAKDKNGGKIILPGQWCVHGVVSEVEHQRRLGRDGFVTVKFDRLVSPDGKYSVPIDASATTHESTAKAVTKVLAKDSVIVTRDAVRGAYVSVRITGIPMAIATHGYSVAAGAAAGAMVGLFNSANRKGKIACGLPGEELQFRFDKPVTLPAFNAAALPSAIPPAKLEDLNILVQKHNFMPDPYEDKSARLLRVSFRMINNSDRAYSFRHLVVISDHNKMYYPYALSMDSLSQSQKSVSPNCEQDGTITFGVDSPKRKYWLVLLDRTDREELTRVPVN